MMATRLAVAAGFLLACSLYAQTGAAIEPSRPAGIFWRYKSPDFPQSPLENSSRLDSLLRAGNLYLSLQDAIALALENNLDIAAQRYTGPMARTDVQRAEGGGLLRGLTLTVNELPAGVGGPGSPLLNAAAGTTLGASTVLTNVPDTFPLVGATTNLSIAGQTPLSNGPVLPMYDPSLVGQLTWQQSSQPQSSSQLIGTPTYDTHTWNPNLIYQQGFSPGTQFQVDFLNQFQGGNSPRLTYNPYSTSTFGFSLVQPLLRGFGPAVNRRYIRIARNNEKVSDTLFRQQVISTVSGIIRLYYDLVSLNEDLRVKRETLALAERLYEDNKTQVEQGTLAPVELTRAQAFMASSRQDLANSEGFVLQQELIVKAVLSRRGTADVSLSGVHIIPTDSIVIPAQDEARPLVELIEQARRSRPELEAARLQMDNFNINLEGSRNEVKPEVDLVASVYGAGLAGPVNPLSSGTGVPGVVFPGFIGGYGTTVGQAVRFDYPTYAVGLQVNLPVRNRVAQADLARDEYQVRQSDIRRQQIENQVQLEVESAMVVLKRTRAALEAAQQTRALQQQSLDIEQEKFNVGLSTNFLLMQYESLLAQAKSTEVAARSAYVKARNTLDRALGATLDVNRVSIDDAYRGQSSRPPDTPPAAAPGQTK